MKGHVTIYKVYKDGTKEVVEDSSNMITAGLGSSVVDLFQTGGSQNFNDYQPAYFQVGTNSIGYNSSLAASSFFYHLSAPLSWSNYGVDSNDTITTLRRGFNASTTDSGASYSEILFTDPTLSSTTFSATTTKEAFVGVGNSRKTKVYFDAVEIEIVLDETTANGNTISEIGLFSKNPKGLVRDTPLLMAYKKFTGIPKTKEYSLVFHWSLGFLGSSTQIDRVFTGTSEDNPTQNLNFYSKLGPPTE